MSSHLATPHHRRSIASTFRCLGVCLLATATSLLAGCDGGAPAGAGGGTTPPVPAVTQTANPAPTQTADAKARAKAKAASPSREEALKTARERAAERKRKQTDTFGVGNGAVLAFHSKTYDFGVITDTQTYETAYRFVNTGTGTLYISDVQASCGCTVPTLEKKQYEPGEDGEIKVVFDPKGKSGRTPKNLTVRSNGDPTGKTTLSFTSLIKPLIEHDGKFVKFGDLPLGEGHTRTYTVRYRDPDLTFEAITINHPHITARVVSEGVPQTGTGGDPMYRADLEINVSEDAPWGSLYACRMNIDVVGRPTAEAEPINWQYTVYLQGNIFGQIRCASTSASGRTMQSAILPIGSITNSGSYEASTRIHHVGNKPFKILETSVSDCNLPGVQVRTEPSGPVSHRLYISGVTGRFKGKVEGTLNVVTDVPGEGPLAIKIIGTVR